MAEPNVETVGISGDVAPQGFASNIDEEDITPKFFDMSELPEEANIYYILPEATKLFLLFLVLGGTYFHLEPSHTVHVRQSKY